MKRALCLLAALSLTGCSSVAYKVATVENGYDFLEARFEEVCPATAPQPVPAWCPTAYPALLAFQKHLFEANAAVQKGGALPLQLKQIKSDEKGVLKLVQRGN